MNGHFEVDQNAYPIGYLRCGDSYKVTDMRCLKPLHSHPIPLADAKDVAADINKAIRLGAEYIKDDRELSLIGAVGVALTNKGISL